jgi:uncharacterized membrane protein YfcA
MEMFMIPVIIIIAVGIGFVSAMFGIGGGFLLNPSMVLLLGMVVNLAVGTIPAVILVMSLSSTIAYARQKRIDFKLTFLVVSTSIVGSILGALLSRFTPGAVILVLFGLVEIVLASILALKKGQQDLVKGRPLHNFTSEGGSRWAKLTLFRHHVDADGVAFEYSANLLSAMPLSLLAGFLSSFLGIGGGTLYIQIFTFLCGMSIHMAIACSMLSVFITSISSFMTFAAIGMVDYVVAAIFAIGGVLGAQLGARVNKRVQSKYLKPMAAVMIMIIAINMIVYALIKNPV